MRDLWQTVRDWAVSGQNETLARLGVRFDRAIFDSQYAPRIEPLVRLALAQGVVSGSPQGPLQFAAGAQGRPRPPLVGY
jgi:arginyl-tRNA synthetase